MDLNAYYDSEMAEHETVFAATRSALRQDFVKLATLCATSVRQGGKILLFGNGGSAGDAQHIATELTVRYVKDRQPIAAIALTTDTSALTAIGNDLGFEQLFARQVSALGKPGDVAIGISTSGTSKNVLLGLAAARKGGLSTAALGGKDGGKLRDFADVVLVVPSQTTARIQEMHITLGQMLCGALERDLGLV